MAKLPEPVGYVSSAVCRFCGYRMDADVRIIRAHEGVCSMRDTVNVAVPQGVMKLSDVFDEMQVPSAPSIQRLMQQEMEQENHDLNLAARIDETAKRIVNESTLRLTLAQWRQVDDLVKLGINAGRAMAYRQGQSKP